MHRNSILATALTAALSTAPVHAAPAQASAPQGAPERGATVAAGTLTCRLSSDVNVIVFSREGFDCTYRAANGEVGRYRGTLGKVGADLQWKRDQVLAWVVLAPAAFGGAKILTGRYAGGSAEATLVGGISARLMIGGSGDQITLQPLSVGAQTGLGASVTLDGLRLVYTGG